MLHIRQFVFSPVQENTYVVYNNTGECIVIDPGCYFEQEKEELTAFITEKGLKPKLLLNTHCHLDHVFGNKFVADTYKLILNIHPGEKQVLDYAPTSGLTYNLPFDNYTGELNWLKEGDVITIGEDKLKVIEAPGHSPGHICFYCKEQDFIISGDVLFANSIGRTDLPGGNFHQLISSIRNKLFPLPDITVVYCGHGESTTIGYEKKNNIFLQ